MSRSNLQSTLCYTAVLTPDAILTYAHWFPRHGPIAQFDVARNAD